MDHLRSHSPLNWVRTAALDAAYLALGLAAGVLTFTVIVTGFSTGLGLAVTLLGIPVLLATLVIVRWLATVERHRAALVLGRVVPSGERRLDGTVWQRVKTLVTDPASWLGTLWSLLLLPIGIAGFTVAVTAWSTALGLATSPIWWWALPRDDPNGLDFFTETGFGYSALRVLVGLALVPIAYWVCRGFALGTAHLARLMLGERQEPSATAPTAVLA